jgi:hypothetical protein
VSVEGIKTLAAMNAARRGVDENTDLRAKLAAAKAVLADRERELLDLKGPCSTCRLHYAHSGPCAPGAAAPAPGFYCPRSPYRGCSTMREEGILCAIPCQPRAVSSPKAGEAS